MRPKLKIGDKESQLEEYRFLVQNFLTRANTANNFWITGFATASALLYGIYDKNDHKILIFSIILLAIFNWAMAWQLEEIVKLRTYMRIVLETRLNIIWERAWYELDKTSRMAKRSRREVVYIFILPYAFFVLTMIYVTYTKKGFANSSCLYYISFIISLIIYLFSMYRVYAVYSMKSFREYISNWKEINKIIDADEAINPSPNLTDIISNNSTENSLTPPEQTGG